ncbi:S-layer protein [Lentilactobacillus raoultii]|uniref:S-layer protein n=1 Tax=Lentilactobacillus raoultii TaxID=1987503 RepID=A0ABW3PD14_9LACO|nr:S-layer protein [Lentilactobacillus raoultii]
MKTNIKRSLFVGLAALSFVAVAGASSNASAAKKSYKIDFNQAASSSTATSRNYVPTGTNALYTKAGVLKSARQVASTATLQSLANSKKGNDYLRGYRVAKLSNGSYYMKVVTFDKAYRGWIYVGKTDPRSNYQSVAGGLKYTDTTTDVTSQLTDAQKKATYQLSNPGTAFESQTFKEPAYTQYKIGRNTTDTTNYKNDTFTVTKAVKRNREGDVWYYVNDAKNPSINGYVLSTSLKQAAGSSSSSSATSTASQGYSQTTVDSTYNVEGYSMATGGKQTSSVRWTIPLMNANVNWNNAVNNFNRDASVKGNKNDVIPSATLKAALKKNGFDTVYMKITPTILPRISGGILDNLDSFTGLYMKFNLDQDALPQNPHYGDTLRLAYTVDDSALYRKGITNSKYESNLNSDGYVGMTIYRQWIKTILDLIVVNPLL